MDGALTQILVSYWLPKFLQSLMLYLSLAVLTMISYWEDLYQLRMEVLVLLNILLKLMMELTVDLSL